MSRTTQRPGLEGLEVLRGPVPLWIQSDLLFFSYYFLRCYGRSSNCTISVMPCVLFPSVLDLTLLTSAGQILLLIVIVVLLLRPPRNHS